MAEYFQRCHRCGHNWHGFACATMTACDCPTSFVDKSTKDERTTLEKRRLQR